MAPKGRRKRGAQRSADRLLVAFSAPALILMTLVLVVPSVFTVILSFTQWRGFGTEMTWVGLRNFTSLWTSDIFRTAMLNTLLLVFGGGALIFAIVFFMLVGLRHMKFAGFARSVVFVPVIISPIAIGVAIGFLLNPQGGVNELLALLNLEQFRQSWLAPDMVFKMIILATVWSVSGFYLAIIATGADQIPDHLYEEADLAGASRWQQFWLITLPLSWEATTVAIVLWMISGMKTFEMVMAMVGAQGVPPKQARTAAVQQYLATTGGAEGVPELGQASAVGIAIFLLTMLFVVLVQRVFRRDRVEIS